MKKATSKLKSKPSDHHFHPILSLTILVIGILGTIVITRVLAQTSQQIYACAQKQTGTLRMIAAGSTCRHDEIAVTWNVQGPPGPSGTSGSSNGLPFMCNNCYLAKFADQFKGKDFSSVQLSNVEFGGADISGVIFKNGFVMNTGFKGTNFTGADLSGMRDLPAWGSNGSNVDMSNANFTNANLSASQFSVTNFKGANFQGANLSNTSLTSVDFTGAQNMSTANIHGVTWINVTCPDGTNSNSNGSTCVGHF